MASSSPIGNRSNLELIQEEICRSPGSFGLPNSLSSSAIHILLTAGLYDSSTARERYLVYLDTNPRPVLVVQAESIIRRSPRRGNNPYQPPGISDLEELLPLFRGEMRIQGRRMFWATFVTWPSLRERFGDCDVYNRVAQRLSMPPWGVRKDASGLAEQALADYSKHVDQLAGDISEIADFKGRLLEELNRGWPRIGFGFSHGDLWVQDVLLNGNEQICILDWEWMSDIRVFGTDLFTLAATALQFGYGLRDDDEVLTRLLHGSGATEQCWRRIITTAWDSAGYDERARRSALLAYMIYVHARTVSQYSKPHNGDGCGLTRSLRLALSDSTYLHPLVRVA